MKTLIFLLLVIHFYPNNLLAQPDVPPDGAAFDTEEQMYFFRKIGEQYWLIEYLNSSRLNDGTVIELVQDSILWSMTSSPAFCYYPNGKLENNSRGNLYNWATVSTEKLCPLNWHVPTNSDWQKLADFAGGNEIAGGKLKTTGVDQWMEPNTGASDEYGFSMIPKSFRSENGEFFGLHKTVAFWSADSFDENNAYIWFVTYNSAYLAKDKGDKKSGLNVICVRD